MVSRDPKQALTKKNQICNQISMNIYYIFDRRYPEPTPAPRPRPEYA